MRTIGISELLVELNQPPLFFNKLAPCIAGGANMEEKRARQEWYRDYPFLALLNGAALLRDATEHGLPQLAEIALNTTIIPDAPFEEIIWQAISESPPHPLTRFLTRLFSKPILNHPPTPDNMRGILIYMFTDKLLSDLKQEYLEREPDPGILNQANFSMSLARTPEDLRSSLRTIAYAHFQRPQYPYDLNAMKHKDLEEKRRQIARMILDTNQIDLLSRDIEGGCVADHAFLMRQPRPYGLPQRCEIILHTMLSYLQQGKNYRPALLPIVEEEYADDDLYMGCTPHAHFFNRVSDTIAHKLQDPQDTLGLSISSKMPAAERAYWLNRGYAISPNDVIITENGFPFEITFDNAGPDGP